MPDKAPATVKAERKTGEILDAIYYSTESLTHQLVRAYRNGMPGASGESAFVLIEATIKEARAAYNAAIAQPENKVAKRPEVSL